MGHVTTQAYETAQTRIKALFAEIGEQLNEVYSTNSVDDVIAEQEKSDFIKKQTDLIANYRFRDDNDSRDAYIAELEKRLKDTESRLKESEQQAKYKTERWYRECDINRNLKVALKSLSAIVTQD